MCNCKEETNCKYTLKLVFFKPSGKFYTEGEYKTNEDSYYELSNAIKRDWKANKLNGVCHSSEFIVYISGNEHPNGYPLLFLN